MATQGFFNDNEDMEDDDGMKALKALQQSNPAEYALLMSDVAADTKTTPMTDDKEVKVKQEPTDATTTASTHGPPPTKIDLWAKGPSKQKGGTKRKQPEAKRPKTTKNASSTAGEGLQPDSNALQQVKDDKKKAADETKSSAVARFMDGYKQIQLDMNGIWEQMSETIKKRKVRVHVEDDDMTERIDLMLPYFADQWKKHVKRPADADKAFSALCEQIMGKKWKARLKDEQYRELFTDMGKAIMNSLSVFYTFVNVKGCQYAVDNIQHMEKQPLEKKKE